MLEIDQVRTAIEGGADFELVDRLSDKYFEVIDIVTSPRPMDQQRINRVSNILKLLKKEDRYIRYLLTSKDYLEEGILGAYDSAVEQVEALAGQQR